MNKSKLKKCKKKIYEIWMCKPPLGTCIINSLEQARVVRQCNGRTYFTASEMAQLKASNPNMYEFLCKNADVTTEKRPFVLCGTGGEMWATGGANIARTYVFASDDSEISPETLQKKAGNKNTLDWTKVRTRADSAECYAQFVPLPQTGQIQTAWGSILTVNDPQVKMHGKGDFILYEILPNGQPNENDKRVVNGAVFKNTYNNIGWTDCLSNDDYTTVADPSTFPKLCECADSVGGGDTMGMAKSVLQQIKAKNVDVSDFNVNNFLRDIDIADKKDKQRVVNFLKLCNSIVNIGTSLGKHYKGKCLMTEWDNTEFRLVCYDISPIIDTISLSVTLGMNGNMSAYVYADYTVGYINKYGDNLDPITMHLDVNKLIQNPMLYKSAVQNCMVKVRSDSESKLGLQRTRQNRI